MKTRTMVVVIAVATGLFVTGAVAQHEEHHADQAAPPADQTDTGKMGGRMSAGMMSEMPRMMMGQDETGKLVERLVKSLAAIEAEKNPAVRKAKLAEHGALLNELQAKVEAQSHRMDTMRHMMGEGMMGEPKK